MKKYFIASLASVATVFFLASCVKETPANESEKPAGGELITITATIPDGGLTKVDMAEESYGGSINLVWHEGDKIIVTDAADATNKQEFTLSDGAGTASGTFTGLSLAEATSYNISYDAIGDNFSYAVQTQAADASTAHLKYAATLTGVSDYTAFEFSDAWATKYGGTFASSSVLRVRADLGELDPADVNAVILKSDAAIFAGGKELKVIIGTPGTDEGEKDFITVYATLPIGDQAIVAGTVLIIQFQMSDKKYDKYTVYRELGAGTILGGKVNGFNIKCRDKDDHFTNTKYANQSVENIGTASNPYLIGDQHQMDAMHDAMEDGETKYFVLIDDVDMTGVDWTSLNNVEVKDHAELSFIKGINFDGKNHTISNLAVGSTAAYPSFVGVLNGTVKDVVFDGAEIVAGANTSGVLAGYVGSGAKIGSLSGITVKNSSVTGGTKNRIGGIAGIVSVSSGTIEDCHVNNVTLASTVDRVGGLFGETSNTTKVSGCTATGVTAEGALNVGGLIGVCYGFVENCWAKDSNLSSVNTASNKDIAIGGLVGYFEDNGDKGAKIYNCYSTVSINQPTNGRDIGGLVGKMLRGTVEKCYATGNVSGKQRNVGGLIGLITNTAGTSTVKDSYCTGTVNGTGGHSGGLVGLIEKGTVSISNCYAAGSSITGSFGIGGLIGYQGTVSLTAQNNVAWVDVITPANYGTSNWSSGAVCGIAHPNCILTDNYRKPGMALTAFWVPSAAYNHPNVNGTTAPLVRIGTDLDEANAAETDLTAFDSSDGQACRWAYHGKVDAEKTLSQLAAALGWDATIWNLDGPVPVLK